MWTRHSAAGSSRCAVNTASTSDERRITTTAYGLQNETQHANAHQTHRKPSKTLFDGSNDKSLSEDENGLQGQIKASDATRKNGGEIRET